jgi:ABC-type Zn2+ transport system substrate-binding protein/surface adhesin
MSDAQAYALSDLVEKFSAEYKEKHKSQPLQFTKEKESVANKEKEDEREKENKNNNNDENENDNGEEEDEEYADDYDEGDTKYHTFLCEKNTNTVLSKFLFFYKEISMNQ